LSGVAFAGNTFHEQCLDLQPTFSDGPTKSVHQRNSTGCHPNSMSVIQGFACWRQGAAGGENNAKQVLIVVAKKLQPLLMRSVS
jgi:hypothetical protein